MDESSVIDLTSDAACGWAGWTGWAGWAHPEFGSSVNPIPTAGGGGGAANYTHHITTCPPGFETLTASLRHSSIGSFRKMCGE